MQNTQASPQQDTTVQMGHSLVQHGVQGNRVYLMKLDLRDCPGIVDELDALAYQNGYTKIIATVPEQARDHFETASYGVEATIPKFFCGTEDGHYMARYLDETRKVPESPGELFDIRRAAIDRSQASHAAPPLREDRSLRRCEQDDCSAMARLYREVFATYPFPIYDPGYLLEIMKSHVAFFGVWQGEELIALASAEMNKKQKYVEMTDFATRPDARRQGLAKHLLHTMHLAMGEEGFCTAFTIARAISTGMNYTFADCGYHFGGTLINNTGIAGTIESMNVWYRELGIREGK